jgi:hypothetical protein
MLVRKHDEFKVYLSQYQNFENFLSIDDFINNLEVIAHTLELTLEFGSQDLAMYSLLI